jgi:hypothetical protein
MAQNLFYLRPIHAWQNDYPQPARRLIRPAKLQIAGMTDFSFDLSCIFNIVLCATEIQQ